MSRIVLHHGDNRDHLRRLIDQGVRVQSVVSDPPYGLTSITKRFGKAGAAPAKFGTDGAFARASGGFMNQHWDASGIERDPEFWQLIHDILLPGGYCVAFSSPRTGHWQACAMEMAGFVMHPFLAWVTGQGFPKAHNAAKAITALERTGGAAPKNMRQARMGADYEPTGQEDYRRGRAFSGDLVDDDRETELTERAKQWEGWAYGGQAMKPAIEPIYVGQRPFSEKNGALNILKHGVGALNIDGCRVHGNDAQGGSYTVRRLKPGAELNRTGGNWRPEDDAAPTYHGEMKPGRHPANLIHDGSPEVVALFPNSNGQLARASSSSSSRKNQNCYGEMQRGSGGAEPRNDSGSASRFFGAFPFTEADYEALADEGVIVDLDTGVICYQPKATKADRAGSKHPTVKPIALMQWLVRLVTPKGGTVLDPFAGSGTTGQAALNEGFDCILMEAEDAYAADIRRRFDLPCPIALPPALAALLGTPEPDLTELIG